MVAFFILLTEIGCMLKLLSKRFCMVPEDKNIKDFATRVSYVLNNTKDYDVDLQFYLTDWCDLGCRGCYMKPKLKSESAVLSASDVDFYLKEFEKVPGFYNTVVFSGGEIFNYPLVRLERNIHSVLDRGWYLQLKTNGSWVAEPGSSKSIFRMLKRLEPGRGMLATNDEVSRFVSRIPKSVLKLLGRERVVKLLFKVFPSDSLLDLAVSVDDRLHPEKSADWFAEIASVISSDRHLRKNINLKTFTVSGSSNFFGIHVLSHPKIVKRIKNLKRKPEAGCLVYTVNGKRVESFFGDFVDVDNIPDFQKISEFVLPSVDGESMGRLVYCFHPDKTVGLDSCYLESVGRVPYIDASGKRKSFSQINQEIQKKLIEDYKQSLVK